MAASFNHVESFNVSASPCLMVFKHHGIEIHAYFFFQNRNWRRLFKFQTRRAARRENGNFGCKAKIVCVLSSILVLTEIQNITAFLFKAIHSEQDETSPNKTAEIRAVPRKIQMIGLSKGGMAFTLGSICCLQPASGLSWI
jgi:hypothetical protein